MAEANENQALLLATGNKSELATGYNTLYGDLAGALCPIADLLKTEVYEMAKFINKKTVVFPKSPLLSREPSAELDYKQKDRDDLPSYSYLDSFLRKFLENKEPKTKKEKDIAYKIQSQEFKRKQAPPLLKLTENDLGESWRRPIAHQFDKA